MSQKLQNVIICHHLFLNPVLLFLLLLLFKYIATFKDFCQLFYPINQQVT